MKIIECIILQLQARPNIHCRTLRCRNSSFLWNWNGCFSSQLSCSLSSLFGQLAVHPPDPKGVDFAKLFFSGRQIQPLEPRDQLSSLSPWIQCWEGIWSLTPALFTAPEGWVLAYIGLFCLMGPWEQCCPLKMKMIGERVYLILLVSPGAAGAADY